MSARLVLHLGVVVQPYRGQSMGRSKAAKPVKVRAVTTGDVAHILEAHYGLFSAFARWQRPAIEKEIKKSMQGAIESLLMGRVVDPIGAATDAIEANFRDYISSRMAERIGLPGVPTQAALRGVNHRLKHPYASSNPRRPSFRDTGLLMASFRAWQERS